MISCQARLVTMDEPGYITMTRRQSKNQWSGGVVAHPAPKNSECKYLLEKFSSASTFGIKTAFSALIIFRRAKLLTRSITYLCLVQMKDILKEKRRGRITKEVLFLHDNAPAHQAHATQNKMAYLGFQRLDHPPYSRDLASSDYHLFPGLKNN